MIHHGKLTLLLFVMLPLAAHSQFVSTAVPFLEINSSPEANAQGCTSISRISDDPYAINFNPAHLGFSSEQTNVTYSFYPTKTQWFPSFGLPDFTFNSYAASGGINFEKYLSLPLSLGVAYSRVDLNYGMINRTGITSPDINDTYNSEEHNNAYSIGFGLDMGVRVAVGFTLRKITSNLGSYTIGNSLELYTIGTTSAWSEDYGLLIDVPIVDLVAKKSELLPGIAPLCDVSFGTALTNVGDKMTYIAQADALPRTITVGTTIDLGIKYAPTNHKLLTITWSRESSSLLVGHSDTLGTSYYRGGFGDINFFKNIIGGKQTTQTENGITYAVTELAQGWQFGLGEVIYFRGGSFQNTGNMIITTSGIGIRASGIFKFLEDFHVPEPALVALLHRHFDIRYDYCKYHAMDDNPLDGTNFSSISLIVKL